MSKLFSDRLRQLRNNQKKAAFARKLGIPAPMYHRYENGQVPKEHYLGVIATRCGVTVDWLLGRADDSISVANGSRLTGPDPPGRRVKIGSVTTTERPFYRAMSEEELESDLAGMLKDLPDAKRGRTRLGLVRQIVEVALELQERCVDECTGRQRAANGSRET